MSDDSLPIERIILEQWFKYSWPLWMPANINFVNNNY